MIHYKNKNQIECMRKSGKIIAKCFKEISESIVPGKTTPLDLNRIAHQIITESGAVPGFLGYRGFPAACCISVNEAVVHGIPNDRVLLDGDIVGVDVGVVLDNWNGDAAWTFPVGTVSAEVKKLLNVTKESLYQGIAKAKVGNRIGDIGSTIQKYVESHGFSVVRDLEGHGIGQSLHEAPGVPNFGKPKTGPVIKEGLTICIEPMVNIGTFQVKTLKDNWTIVTADGKYSAHFEHMIAIAKSGVDILTAE